MLVPAEAAGPPAGLRTAALQGGSSFQGIGHNEIPARMGILVGLGPIDAAALQSALTPINLSISAGDVGIRHAPIAVPAGDTSASDALLNMVSADTMQLSGTALSVGAVWWVSRSATLLTSLLISTPVWRQLDPLPVFNAANGEPDDDDDGAEGQSGLNERDALRRAESLFSPAHPSNAEEIN